MTFLKTIAVAFSTYSALPMPQFPWDEKHMRYAICAFPLVGVVCGGVMLLWSWLCGLLGGSAVLFAAVAVCLPLLLTGGIHMDGFMDTVDALASHQPRQRKLEILKDPHCGAFAVLWCGVYLLLSLGLWHEIHAASLYIPALVYVLSRALSALCAVTMPNARKEGMLHAFTAEAQRSRAAAGMILLTVLAGGVMVWLSPLQGGLTLAAALVTTVWYRFMAKRKFGGATGDTAGFFLQTCELTALAGFWLGGVL